MAVHIIEQCSFATRESRHLFHNRVSLRFLFRRSNSTTTCALVFTKVVDVDTVLRVADIVLRGDGDVGTREVFLVLHLLGLVDMVYDFRYGESNRCLDGHLLHFRLRFFFLNLNLLFFLLRFVLLELREFRRHLFLTGHRCLDGF